MSENQETFNDQRSIPDHISGPAPSNFYTPISAQLESIVKQTEENLYGRPRNTSHNNDSYSQSNIWVTDNVYPLTLENYYTKLPKSRQLHYIDNRQVDYLDDQFRKDVVKNIGILH